MSAVQTVRDERQPERGTVAWGSRVTRVRASGIGRDERPEHALRKRTQDTPVHTAVEGRRHVELVQTLTSPPSADMKESG